MSRILACAAAALLAVPAATSAQEAIPGYQPSAFEQSLATIEQRMEEFGERAERIADDESLSEDEREARVAALWSEYAPDLSAFTASAADFGTRTAGAVMENMDVAAMVEASLREADLEGQIAEALAEADIEGQIALAMAEADIEGVVAAALADSEVEIEIDADVDEDAEDTAD